MEVEKAIIGRRSVRDYLDKDVPEEVLEQILKAGAMAPSAMDKQPCRFIVIQDKKLIKELSDKVKQKAGVLGMAGRLAERLKLKKDVIFYGAPLLILIMADKTDWAETDCALAAQNMMLRAYDLGLGSCFIGFMKLIADDKENMASVGVKDGQKMCCQLIFGYPKEWPKPKERDAQIQERK